MSTATPLDGTAATRPTHLALGVLAVVLTVVAGPLGTLAGVATAAVWYALGTPYAVAAGHVALPVAFPGGIEPLVFAAVELAFLALVLATALESAQSLEDAPERPLEDAPERPLSLEDAPTRALEYTAVVLAGVFGLGGVTWFVLREGSLALAAASLLGLVVLASIVLDRYERLRLGLLSEQPTDSISSTEES